MAVFDEVVHAKQKRIEELHRLQPERTADELIAEIRGELRTRGKS